MKKFIGLLLTMFPSPHGDKFQRYVDFVFRGRYFCFRPLTGINFNS